MSRKPTRQEQAAADWEARSRALDPEKWARVDAADARVTEARRREVERYAAERESRLAAERAVDPPRP